MFPVWLMWDVEMDNSTLQRGRLVNAESIAVLVWGQKAEQASLCARLGSQEQSHPVHGHSVCAAGCGTGAGTSPRQLSLLAPPHSSILPQTRTGVGSVGLRWEGGDCWRRVD